MSTGSDMPVIDLQGSSLSAEFVMHACPDVDFVILEGMGRGIETNLNAQFLCDSLKIGMIKHREVAECLSARLYDGVCKFTRGLDLRN